MNTLETPMTRLVRTDIITKVLQYPKEDGKTGRVCATGFKHHIESIPQR